MPCPFPDTNNTLTPTLQHTQPHTLASIYVLKIFEWKKSIVSFFTISYFLLPAIACYPRSRSARFESYRMPVESLSLSTHTRALSLTHTRAPTHTHALTHAHSAARAPTCAPTSVILATFYISFYFLSRFACMCVYVCFLFVARHFFFLFTTTFFLCLCAGCFLLLCCSASIFQRFDLRRQHTHMHT